MAEDDEPERGRYKPSGNGIPFKWDMYYIRSSCSGACRIDHEGAGARIALGLVAVGTANVSHRDAMGQPPSRLGPVGALRFLEAEQIREAWRSGQGRGPHRGVGRSGRLPATELAERTEGER